MEPQAHLKRVVVNRVVKGFVVAMLNIRKYLIPCGWMFGSCTFFPSVCGWKEVDLVSLVSIIDHRMDQKLPRNLLS
jgi:hypothetical protein